MINYDHKVFRSVTNTDNGEVSDETIFHYKQEGSIIHAEYKGGNILFGTLVGTVNDQGRLSFRYNHVNTEYELRGGICTSIPEILSDGRIRLHEKWKWLDDENSEGESIIEEIKELT
ncbi:n-acetylglutamate synthase [Paenibacillus sediminis]|uniref:N-acetylglutamate synthase n=1 Tax=Paenibacillus sediminis TaxID=664909 RepID=A0ABS4GY91_9BACL|nr:n-acetylglutamate synthase [Paenibacillus sediminis]MBP1935233.1 hypothetical protein [Paenibacillus sediminis]